MDVGEQGVLVPSRALDEVARLVVGDTRVGVQLDERTVLFEVGDTRLSARLINGDFPSYEGLIPTAHPNRLVTDRQQLLDAIRRVRLLAPAQRSMRVRMQPGNLTLSATAQDVGEAVEEVSANYDGEELLIAFNAEYLHDGVEVLDSEEILLLTADSLKPALLQSPGGRGLRVRADALAGDLRSCSASVAGSTRLPSSREHRVPPGGGSDRRPGAERHRQDVTAGGGRLPRIAVVVPGAPRRRISCAPAPRRQRSAASSAWPDGALLVEASVPATGGRTKVQLNRRPVRRVADLQEQLPVLAFQPDDLTIVKGPPSARRDALDDAIVTLRPRRGEERRRLATCLRQRNALLRQVGSAGPERLAEADRRSLDVWDDRLAAAAEEWAGCRREAVATLQPPDGAPLRAARGWRRRTGRDVLRTFVAGRRAVGGARRGPAARISGAGSRQSGPTATTSSGDSTTSRHARTPPRAISERWPSPSAWPCTRRSPRPPARRPCCCWTTSSPNWTRPAGSGCWKCCRRGRSCWRPREKCRCRRARHGWSPSRSCARAPDTDS